ncbi:hypothetical protein PAPHI01_2006 [Pancytospora philotis]|nr:hypothetical protein PAPHI01_2006 [Pancytospora philotis]
MRDTSGSPHSGSRLRYAVEDREEKHSTKTDATTPETFQSNYNEEHDSLYTVLKEVRYAPARTYGRADSAATKHVRPTFSTPDLEKIAWGDGDFISVLYRQLWNVIFTDDSYEDEMWNLTRFGRFYFINTNFEGFLARWEKNRSNSRYHFTLDEAIGLRHKVEGGTSFHRLSAHEKQLFAKLVFVRNTLEAYSMLRDVVEPLGLTPSEPRTDEDFLQAVYGYLTAVHKSNGKLAVGSSVRLAVLASELLSLAYAECHSFARRSDRVIDKVFAPEDHMDEIVHLYIEGMIVIFKAWFGSTKTYIDPAVLSNVTDEFYSFIRPIGNYYNGCQQRVLG